jgi:hypothetical protein
VLPRGAFNKFKLEVYALCLKMQLLQVVARENLEIWVVWNADVRSAKNRANTTAAASNERHILSDRARELSCRLREAKLLSIACLGTIEVLLFH